MNKITISDVVPSEHFEQRELVRWFRQTWPGVLILATPNGGARSKATAGRLKAEGVVSGVPDLFIPAWRLWIEMKRVKGGSISPEQRSIIKQLETVGYRVIVGKGAEDAKRQIVESLSRHRAAGEYLHPEVSRRVGGLEGKRLAVTLGVPGVQPGEWA